MRRVRVLVLSAACATWGLAACAPLAQAVDFGQTATVDRPLGALPFDGIADSRSSGTRAVSGNGRYVVFLSFSDALVPGVGGGIFRFDRTNGEVILVSRNDDDTTMPGFLDEATVSDDGNVVAFSTDAPADPADTNTSPDIYVRNISAGTTTLASCAMGPGPCLVAPAGGSGQPSISGDGTMVVWRTSNDLTDASIDDTDNTPDIYARRAGVTYLVSVNTDETADNSFNVAAEPDVNIDGSRIVFTTEAVLATEPVTTDPDNGATDIYMRRNVVAPNPSTELVSHNGSGVAINGYHASVSDTASGHTAFATGNDIYLQHPTSVAAPVLVSAADGTANGAHTGAMGEAAISADATAVAFAGDPSNIAPGAGTGQRHIYIRNISPPTTTLVDRTDGAGGTPAFNSRSPSISDNGSVVGFDSFSPLDPAMGVTSTGHVYLRVGSDTIWASRPPSGPLVLQAGTAALEDTPAQVVTPDGRYVLVRGSRSTLVGGSARGLVRRDMVTGEVTRIDLTSTGALGTLEPQRGSISSDGRRVAFQTDAPLTPGDNNSRNDVYLRDIAAGTTTRVSNSSTESAFDPVLSADGTTVAYSTSAAHDAMDTNDDLDIYVYDIAAGSRTLITRPGPGAPAAGGYEPVISADGNRVGFLTESDLYPGDSDTRSDVVVVDRAAGTVTIASRTAGGGAPDLDAYNASLSADGTRVLWNTQATNMGNGDSDMRNDLHVRTLATSEVQWASRNSAGVSINNVPTQGRLSADGTKVLFTSEATNITGGEADDDTYDVFLRDMTAGTTRLAARASGGGKPTTTIFTAAMSADGACIVFDAIANDLDPAGYPSLDYSHVYLHALTRACPASPVVDDPPTGAGTGTGTGTGSGTGAAGPGTGTLPLPGTTSAKDTARPVITNAGVRSARSRRVRISYTISENATVTIKVLREVRGTRRSGRCVKRRATGRRCTRLLAAGTVTRSVKKGKVTLTLAGKVGSKRLALGPHRITIRAKDTAGNLSATTTKRFTVRR